MNTNLIRTTTYFDQTLLNLAKKQAIDEGKKFYQIVNEALVKTLKEKMIVETVTKIKTIEYKKLFPTFSLGLGKKKISRNDAYEL